MAVILFSVKVPVLSVQIIFTEPIVSQAIIFFTRAFCFDILITFIARDTATIVGSPSGTAATRSTMEFMNISAMLLKSAFPLPKREIS